MTLGAYITTFHFCSKLFPSSCVHYYSNQHFTYFLSLIHKELSLLIDLLHCESHLCRQYHLGHQWVHRKGWEKMVVDINESMTKIRMIKVKELKNSIEFNFCSYNSSTLLYWFLSVSLIFLSINLTFLVVIINYALIYPTM